MPKPCSHSILQSFLPVQSSATPLTFTISQRFISHRIRYKVCRMIMIQEPCRVVVFGPADLFFHADPPIRGRAPLPLLSYFFEVALALACQFS